MTLLLILTVLSAALLAFGRWMEKNSRTGVQSAAGNLFILAGLGLAMVILALALAPRAAVARDLGQWEAADPVVKQWYRSLMQPDVPTMSCCGEADAYWADDVHVRNGKTIAVITDDRPDEPLGRPHIDVGTEIEIPNNKLKWDRANPTGHGVVFVSRNMYVFCYVQPGGV